jgi:uncharacterized protein YcbK (DUF882 family)
MAELAHDHANCLVCRAKVEAPRRLVQAAALFAAGLCVTTGVLELMPAPAKKATTPAAAPKLAKPEPIEVPRPVVRVEVSTEVRDAAAAELSREAALGTDRGLVLASPGGVFATAARVAAWRPLVRRAAATTGFDADLLEAIVYVESSGRATVTAGSHAGLTQLSPRPARRLGLYVNRVKSERLTRQIAHTRGSRRAKQLRLWRARYDERFRPAKSLHATAAYLASAQKELGRDDLAVQSYHQGLSSLRAYNAPVAQLYARSSAVDSYYFRVLAAKRIMHLYRSNKGALTFEIGQQLRKSSSEEYLHPRSRTHQFRNPNAIVSAWKRRVLRAIPMNAQETHVAVGPFLGERASRLGRSRRIYRGLRKPTLDVLLYIGQRVHEISGAKQPLIVTSAVRDNRYQRSLMRVNANAARSYSIHTTGYAFDIARVYANDRQARAFQFVLDRLSAINAIAYIRESAAIHIAVAGDAAQKLKLLQTLS